MAEEAQHHVTRKQAEEAYEWVNSDLETLEKMARTLMTKLPPSGSMLPDDLYLEMSAISILPIAQLEYFLKYLEKIECQSDIPKVIEGNKTLTRKEKDHLLYLFLIRHTVVHNGGHYDEKFFNSAKKYIKETKISIPEGNSYLTPMTPESIVIAIRLIKKLIEDCLQEIA